MCDVFSCSFQLGNYSAQMLNLRTYRTSLSIENGKGRAELELVEADTRTFLLCYFYISHKNDRNTSMRVHERIEKVFSILVVM